MRLNKEMKENIVKAIIKDLENPYDYVYSMKGEMEKKLQNIVLKLARPSFKAFLDDYPGASAWQHAKYTVGNSDGGLYVNVPTYLFLYDVFGTSKIDAFDISAVKTDAETKQEIEDLIKFYQAFNIKCKEFSKLKNDIEQAVYSCSTDVQLRKLYPDFAPYLQKIGAVPTEDLLPVSVDFLDKMKDFGFGQNQTPA